MGLTRRSFKRCEISRRRSRWKGAALRPPHQGLIVDLCTGDLIKLDSVGRVTAALHGERWRSLDEIATVYGVAEWRLYSHLSRVENHRDYWLLVTAFDTPAQPIWARIVDLMARGDARVAHVPKHDFCAVQRQCVAGGPLYVRGQVVVWTPLLASLQHV